MEKYLVGVVRAEISYKFPEAAIQAQAIASRSYAYYLFLKNPEATYHLGTSSRFQVFKGLANVPEKIRKNVTLTKGLVLVYDGKPILTFFHASCGGITAQPHEVWAQAKPLPYFKNTRCNYCVSHPRFSWQARYSTKTLTKRFEKLDIGTVRKVQIKKVSASQRVQTIEIMGSKKRLTINGNTFRIMLDPIHLSSTKFTLKREKNSYFFKGNGFGHGVGLCQWGAKTMGERGYSMKKILYFYYKNTTIVKKSLADFL